ncbi:lytic transglycosylase domain-containing protein [Rhizobium sp. A22-96]
MWPALFLLTGVALQAAFGVNSAAGRDGFDRPDESGKVTTRESAATENGSETNGTHQSAAQLAVTAGITLDNYIGLFFPPPERKHQAPPNNTNIDTYGGEDERGECGASTVNPAGIELLVRRAAAKYSIDSDFALAIAWTESRYDRVRNSPRGARGPMQLMPETASRFGVTDICDPASNIDAGVHYLRILLDRFGNQIFAAAAYNAGEHAVYQHDGVPAFPETVRYVAAVINRQLGAPVSANPQQGSERNQPDASNRKPPAPGVIGAPSANFVNGVLQFSNERN